MSRNKKRKRYWDKKINEMDPEKNTEETVNLIDSNITEEAIVPAPNVSSPAELEIYPVNENGNTNPIIQTNKMDDLFKEELQKADAILASTDATEEEDDSVQETTATSKEAIEEEEDDSVQETTAEEVPVPRKIGIDPLTLFLIFVVVALIIFIIYRVAKRNGG